MNYSVNGGEWTVESFWTRCDWNAWNGNSNWWSLRLILKIENSQKKINLLKRNRTPWNLRQRTLTAFHKCRKLIQNHLKMWTPAFHIHQRSEFYFSFDKLHIKQYHKINKMWCTCPSMYQFCLLHWKLIWTSSSSRFLVRKNTQNVWPLLLKGVVYGGFQYTAIIFYYLLMIYRVNC